MIGREDEVREYREQIPLLTGMLLMALGLLAARLVYLQLMKGEELRKYSEANRLKKEKLFPTRGVIFDRNGKVIVGSRAAFDVVMLSQYYKPSRENNNRLANALQMELPELEKRIAKTAKSPSYVPVLLKADVSKDIIAAIEMGANFPGIDIETTIQRRYPYGDVASQVLGYVGEVSEAELKSSQFQSGDDIGKAGLERTYDSYLRGQNGIGYVEVDVLGRRKKSEGGEKLLGFVSQTEPVPGNNIYLTLDADLQMVAVNLLKNRGFYGSAVAIDPRSGEVLVMVNEPSYDPGSISGREVNPKVWAQLRENRERPLRNRAIQDHYPPGSTFKAFVAIAALAEGVAMKSSGLTCHGFLPFGNRRFSCWKRHGAVDFIRSIRESCDVYYYNLGTQLEIDRIAKYARLFGLGERTRLHLAIEQKGLIPDSQWKLATFQEPWQRGETLSVAIGQGYVAVTPIQLVAAYAAIGNGGFLYQPYIVKRIEGRGGDVIKEFPPALTRRIEIPSEVFEIVKEGLYQVTNAPFGTAYWSGRSTKVAISGKTGTSQVKAFSDIMKKKCENLERKDRHHGWFVGYAPRENPQIAVAVISEHSCHGTASAPVVREIIEAYFDKEKGAAVVANEPKGNPPSPSVVKMTEPLKKKPVVPMREEATEEEEPEDEE